MSTKFAALLAILSHARELFAPAYNPTMKVPMSTADAVTPLAALEASPYVQPLQYVQPVSSRGSAWPYAGAGVLLVAGVAAIRGQQTARAVAEPDLESANGAVRVAMLFSSGKSSTKAKPKKAAPKGKPAAKGKAAPTRKVAKPAAKGKVTTSQDVESDLFYHAGTSGFVGDRVVDRTTRNVVNNAFVNRAGWVFDPLRPNTLKKLKINQILPSGRMAAKTDKKR
jgi:hypothetical protein